jgi:pimeloyl-ACP methyl ester carboxylesterase
VIRRVALAAGAIAIPIVAARTLARRGARRILEAPRTTPSEASLGAALDALGGEIVQLRSRDGLRLAGRWLPSEDADGAADGGAGDGSWAPEAHEAVLLLHGWSGSIAPDLVEYGPFLRRTAGVLGLDFRGHGGSDEAPTTFGMNEVEDVAGALAWLGERGIERVALVGTSMGAMTAIASVGVLGDGSLVAADADPTAPIGVVAPPRPRIVAVVADSAAPELVVPVAARMRTPLPRAVAGRLFGIAAGRLGADPRATEPLRMIGLVAPVPILLIHGEADTTVPLADGRRLAAVAGPSSEHWEVPDAEHSGGHVAAPAAYEARVTAFLRRAFAGTRGQGPIIAAPEDRPGVPRDPAKSVED